MPRRRDGESEIRARRDLPMSNDAQQLGQRARPRTGQLDGMINVNKPAGMTSMDVVRRIKRASRQKRVGHGGTLDPFASGVIPICLGQATRMMEYLIEGTRTYRAVVELGVETDTYDIEGAVTGKGDASGVTLRDIEAAAASFKGNIEQVPPMYSALKRQGRRLYELAREGIEVERKPRHVEVMSIEVLGWSPPLVDLQVHCGRGFYMRSLAYDLGKYLGCGGHLRNLVRLGSGAFHVSDAVALEEAERSFEDGTWERRLHPLDMVVGHLRAAIVGRRIEEMFRHGRPLPGGLHIPHGRPREHCRVYSIDGRFVAVMTFDPSAGSWQPDRVFNLHYSDLIGSGDPEATSTPPHDSAAP